MSHLVISPFGSVVVTFIEKAGVESAKKIFPCYKIITKINNHKYQMNLHNVPFVVGGD